MNRLEQLREEAQWLADNGRWVYFDSVTDFFSIRHLDGKSVTIPKVQHFTHEPCMLGDYGGELPLPIHERTVACVMPNGPNNVLYHRAGECPRIYYERVQV